MKKRVLTKWLKALRSGKYKQGRGALCQIDKKGNESFCCLGVLCDLYNKEQKRNKKRGLDVEDVSPESCLIGTLTSKPDLVRTYGECDGTLPDVVVKWAGFREYNSDGHFLDPNGGKSPAAELISLNDGNESLRVKKRNFKQIADTIEKYHNQL